MTAPSSARYAASIYQVCPDFRKLSDIASRDLAAGTGQGFLEGFAASLGQWARAAALAGAWGDNLAADLGTAQQNLDNYLIGGESWTGVLRFIVAVQGDCKGMNM